MALTIFKYEFVIRDRVDLRMPRGAEILTVQIQHGVPVLLARVDTAEPQEVRTLLVFGTGHDLPDRIWDEMYIRYIGTIQMAHGDLVWHVFEDRIAH